MESKSNHTLCLLEHIIVHVKESLNSINRISCYYLNLDPAQGAYSQCQYRLSQFQLFSQRLDSGCYFSRRQTFFKILENITMIDQGQRIIYCWCVSFFITILISIHWEQARAYCPHKLNNPLWEILTNLSLVYCELVRAENEPTVHHRLAQTIFQILSWARR